MKVIQIEDIDRLYNQFDELKSEIRIIRNQLQPKEPTKLLTRQEVADFLSIALPTVADWTKKGILKAYRYGNRVYYKRSEVEQGLLSDENPKSAKQ